jgi:hypothetical protein
MEHRNQMLLEQKQEAERLQQRKAIVEVANEKAQREKELIEKGKGIAATTNMINKEIYRQNDEETNTSSQRKQESSDIWGDDDEIETLPGSGSSASRPTTATTN